MLRWLPASEEVLSNIEFDKEWGVFIGSINESIRDGLQICDDVLSRRRPDEVDEAGLATLLDEVRSLIDEVVASTIDDQLKQYMLKHLGLVELAIADYRIQGSEPLNRVFSEAVGSVVLNGDIPARTRESELGQRFWKIMGRLAIVVTLTGYTPKLANQLARLLPEPCAAVNSEPSSHGVDAEETELEAVSPTDG